MGREGAGKPGTVRTEVGAFSTLLRSLDLPIRGWTVTEAPNKGMAESGSHLQRSLSKQGRA